MTAEGRSHLTGPLEGRVGPLLREVWTGRDRTRFLCCVDHLMKYPETLPRPVLLTEGGNRFDGTSLVLESSFVLDDDYSPAGAPGSDRVNVADLTGRDLTAPSGVRTP